MDIFLLELQLCSPLFLLVFAGWGLRKLRIFSDEVAVALTSFSFRFLIPVMLFELLSDLSNMPPVDFRVLFGYFGSCFIVYFGTRLFYKRAVSGITAGGATIMAMAGIFSNNVQLGIPVLNAGLGSEAMPTASLVIIFNVVILWTLAIASQEFSRQAEAAGGFTWRSILVPVRRVFQNPVVIGIIAGTLWGLTGWKLPAFIQKSASLVSGGATPVCLIAVGMGLARYSFFGSIRKTAVITAVKLAVQPLLVYALCRLFGVPLLETQTATLMAALPVGINVYLMAAELKSEQGAASSSILLSTLLSAFTVPLVLTIFGVHPGA